jgi:geranylgeranyl reductase family protein
VTSAGAVRDVIVVGGGPAGAATAGFLARAGHDVLVLDEARFPRDKVCGESVSPEAWRLLAELGAADAVRALRPHPIRGMRLVAPDGTSFCGDYGQAPEGGFAVRRPALDAALLATARAAGAEVREGVRVSGLLGQGGPARAVIAENGGGPEVLRARILVAADGRRSVVARRLGLLREHSRLRKYAVRGHWEGMQGLQERGEMHVGAGGYCGVAPLSPASANVTFVLDRAQMGAAGGDLERFYRDRLRRWPSVAERLAGARLLEAPRAIGPLAIQAERVWAPGVLLVGDSAGFYDPFTGEGVTLALRSAELAAGVASGALRSNRAGATADLSEYDRRRRRATRDKFRVNRLLQEVVARPVVANALARRLLRRPDLADQLVGIAGDLVPARSALGPRFLYELLTGSAL